MAPNTLFGFFFCFVEATFFSLAVFGLGDTFFFVLQLSLKTTLVTSGWTDDDDDDDDFEEEEELLHAIFGWFSGSTLFWLFGLDNARIRLERVFLSFCTFAVAFRTAFFFLTIFFLGIDIVGSSNSISSICLFPPSPESSSSSSSSSS